MVSAPCIYRVQYATDVKDIDKAVTNTKYAVVGTDESARGWVLTRFSRTNAAF